MYSHLFQRLCFMKWCFAFELNFCSSSYSIVLGTCTHMADELRLLRILSVEARESNGSKPVIKWVDISTDLCRLDPFPLVRISALRPSSLHTRWVSRFLNTVKVYTCSVVKAPISSHEYLTDEKIEKSTESVSSRSLHHEIFNTHVLKLGAVLSSCWVIAAWMRSSRNTLSMCRMQPLWRKSTFRPLRSEKSWIVGSSPIPEHIVTLSRRLTDKSI